MLQALQTELPTTTTAVDSPSPEELCINTPPTKLDVTNGIDIIDLNGSGYVRYFCNNNTLNPNHGEAFANVSSPDGTWVGIHEYPTEGVSMGMPTWFIQNTITGENRTIWGENKPIVRQNAPNGNPVDWWRRAVYHDISSYDTVGSDNYTIITGPSQAKAYYALRTDTTSDPRPNTTQCDNDIDVDVPFTAKYSFISCDLGLIPLAAPPPMVPPPLIAPIPAPAPPEPMMPPPPLLLPTEAPPPPTQAPPAPIFVPVLPAAVAPPPASSANAVHSGRVAFGILAATLAWVM